MPPHHRTPTILGLLSFRRADFEFTTTRGEGAILILPDGAVLSEIQDEDKLKQIRKHAERCASQWCAIAKRNSLYLITAVYKSKSWTLGSFEKGTPGKEILVQRQSCNDSGTDSTYEWKYEINVVPQQGPGNNYYVNQTVLIKGFKMTVMWGLLPIVEQVEKTRWWITNFFLSLWSTFSQRWLSPVGKQCSHVVKHLSTQTVYSHRLLPVSELFSGLYRCLEYCMCKD